MFSLSPTEGRGKPLGSPRHLGLAKMSFGKVSVGILLRHLARSIWINPTHRRALTEGVVSLNSEAGDVERGCSRTHLK